MTTNEDRIFELEKQLHEQYAVNNNSNAGILISLISALIVSFTGYGYVLYQHSIEECNNIKIINLAAIAVIAVMVLLYCICIHLGAGQRMEQFITIAIRKKHYSKSDVYNVIFPDGYHPFNKNFCTFVQGLYNMWSKVTILAILGVMSCHISMVITDRPCLVVTAGVVGMIFCIIYRYCKYKKYKYREQSLIGQYTHLLHDIIDDRKYFSYCNVVCWIVVISFITLSLWFVITTCICNKVWDDDKSRRGNTLNIKIENSDPIKVQIID